MIASTRSVWKLSLGDSRARASKILHSLARGSRFGSGRLEDEDRQEDLGILMFSVF